MSGYKRCPRCGFKYEVDNDDLDLGMCDECYDAQADEVLYPGRLVGVELAA